MLIIQFVGLDLLNLKPYVNKKNKNKAKNNMLFEQI
jgi:hypothetical protein